MAPARPKLPRARTDRRAPAAELLLDAAAAERLRGGLLAWYREHRRDLPWRRTRDPYAIWVSEAMLQQTRVETVVPYWRRFLERFPDVARLAAAREEDVLAAWSGLGYYRRARSLHGAARAIVELHGGRFPRTREALEALPGVGPYTAGAVLSIAFDRPEPLVDGNVARVLARLFRLEEPSGSGALARRAWSLAAALVPREARGERGPGEWNQALMELGATVCLAAEPRCLACPVREWCRAAGAGVQASLPRPGRRVTPLDVSAELLLVARQGRVLLTRRPPGGRMAELWELPARERPLAGGAPRLFPARFPLLEEGTRPRAGARLGELRHQITHHRLRVEVRRGTLGPSGARAGEAPATWIAAGELDALALTGLARKVLRAPFARVALGWEAE